MDRNIMPATTRHADTVRPITDTVLPNRTAAEEARNAGRFGP
jgi:hypothetical protein